MSSGSSTPPSLINDLPTASMSSMSLQDLEQALPALNETTASSDSSLSIMAHADSAHGAMLAADGSDLQSTDPNDNIFARSQLDDDVFGRNTSSTSGQVVKTRSTTDAVVAKVQSNLATPITIRQEPRSDRINSPITPANAQGVLPPEACVFVANLATARTDDQLEISCHNHFDVFGECHIKVRRDKHKHPFAMVQYYNVEDANNAIRSSRDIVIDGRNIRTEHAQARRSLVLTRIGGGAITDEEAKGLLGNFGPISHMHPTTNSDARNFGLPEGIWIQFAYYLDYKDAVRTFNATTTDYRIHVPPEVEARTHSGPSGSPIVRGFRTPRSTTDQKSIFVGNLPSETTEQHLRHAFKECGIIRFVNIIHKPIHGGRGYNVFGFIEFSAMSEAELAASLEIELNGTKIRVEPKEYSARRHTRLQYSPMTTPQYREQRQTGYYNNQNIPINYSPSFYGIQTPQTHTNIGYNSGHHYNELSPFHAHPGYANVYATPPPTSRIARRGDMHYTGSPHYNPFITGSNYTNAMMQIPEELEGQRY